MIKFFVRILKFSGKYKGRVLSAALFAFIKGICIMMPLFLGFLLFNEFYEGTITVLRCLIYFAGMAASLAVHILATNLSDRLQSTAGYKIFAEKRMELGARLRKLPMGYFTAGNIGKISSVLSSDMVFVEENVMQSIADMLGNGFSALLINTAKGKHILNAIYDKMYLYETSLDEVVRGNGNLSSPSKMPVQRKTIYLRIKQEGWTSVEKTECKYNRLFPVVSKYIPKRIKKLLKKVLK